MQGIRVVVVRIVRFLRVPGGNSYFSGKRLDADDLSQEQEYTRQKHDLHDTELHDSQDDDPDRP